MPLITTSTLIAMAISLAISLAMMGIKMLLAPKGGGQPGSQGQKLTVRDAAGARQVCYGEARVWGNIIFMATTDGVGEKNLYLHVVIAYTTHEITGIVAHYANDQEVAIDGDGNAINIYQGHLGIKTKLGGTGQTAFAELVAENIGWTNTDVGTGCFLVYYKMKYNDSVWPQGFPQFSVTIDGAKIYDPRTDTTYFTGNSALVIADYLTNPLYGLGEDWDNIDLDTLIASANICDETPVSSEQYDTRRYSTNGTFKLDRQPIEILTDLNSAFAGWVMQTDGKWYILAGDWREPEIEFTVDDLDGELVVDVFVPIKDSFNGVRGKHAYVFAKYAYTDFPEIKSNEYLLEDNGREAFMDVNLPYSIFQSQTSRIGTIHLRRARQQLMVTWPGKMSCYRAMVGDNVMITSASHGWTQKIFEVQNMKFVWRGDNETKRIGVDLVLRETASYIYDYTLSDENLITPPDNTTLPDVYNPQAPGSLSTSEELYVARDAGGVKTRVILECDASPDAFVNTYQFEYMVVGDADFTKLPRVHDPYTTMEDATPGNYIFRVAGVNVANVSTDYITSGIVTIVGTAAEPSAPANVSIELNGGNGLLRWDRSGDLDVYVGGSVVIRHTSLLTGATWADGIRIVRDQPGDSDNVIVPVKAGTYMIKFVDSTGHFSDSFGSAISQQSSIHTFTTLASRVEDPAFTGTCVNCVVDGGVLKLVSDYLFDSVSDVDALDDWDYYGGVATSGTYSFGNVDLGAKTKARITSTISSLVFNALDEMDSWFDVDSRPFWDGDVTGNEADAQLYVAYTDDNPSGSPTWSAWQRIEAGEYDARGFKFQLALMSNSEVHSISISQLRLVAEGVV